MTRSTISGNTAVIRGGGIDTDLEADALLWSVTGSIISGNTAASSADVFGKFTKSFSLIGGPDPMLGPLADNGGPTKTHALLPGSPAIDAGKPDLAAPPQFDQRGAPFDRVVNGRIDIGAFEFSPSLPGDLTGNGFVDFDDLAVLLANWDRDVSAALGNLVDAARTPVDFDDLAVLLSAWTGPGGAGSPNPAEATASGVASVSTQGAATRESRTATDAHFHRMGRRDHATWRRTNRASGLSAHDTPLRRLQPAAVDWAMGEEAESTLARRRSAFVRRRR